MGWLQQSTGGVRNTTIAVAVVLGLGAAALLYARGGRSVHGPSTDPGASSAAASAAASDEPAAPRAPRATVTLARLAQSEDYKGKDVCTCGFVHSSGSSRAQGIDKVRHNILNNVFVSEAPGPSPADGGGANAICTWMGGDPPNVKADDPVCVSGQYIGPVIKRCSVVPSCP